MKRNILFSLFVVMALLVAACGDTTVEEPVVEEPVVEATVEAAEEPADAAVEGNTIVDIAVADGNFNTLVEAVTAAGLAETLSGEGPFTVFAPTDDAFAALPDGTLDTLLSDPQGDLADVLLYHVTEGAVMSGDLSDGMQVPTMSNGIVVVTINDGSVMVNDAMVVTADIEASNGVIHVIDSVLIPPDETEEEVIADVDAMTDTEAMTDGEMMTDDAVMTDSMEMTDGEMMTDSMEMTDTEAGAVDDMGSIVDVASEAGQFNTLLTAATEAGLAETLATGGPFTVFAPTDDAFAAVEPATLDAAMADPEGLLAEVLTYHVVDGAVMSGDLSDGMEVETLNGGTLTITIDGDTVMVNDAIVTAADVEASNGVIHVIDSVLLP